MTSWKTTLAGVIAILGGIVTLLQQVQNGHLDTQSITAAVSAIGGGVGLLFARDGNVSDEKAGVAPAQAAIAAPPLAVAPPQPTSIPKSNI